jgi:hypothetical protein
MYSNPLILLLAAHPQPTTTHLPWVGNEDHLYAVPATNLLFLVVVSRAKYPHRRALHVTEARTLLATYTNRVRQDQSNTLL